MSACEHTWSTGSGTLPVTYTIDDWLGPTLFMTTCSHCGQPAVLRLIAWKDKNLTTRLFGVTEIEPAVARTYLENVNRDYCDLTRKSAETDTLMTAGEESILVVVSVPAMIISAAYRAHQKPPLTPWQDIDPEAFDNLLPQLEKISSGE